MDAISAGQIGFFITVLGVAILTPGPAIIACARSAAARGMGVSLPYSLGLAFGAALWCLTALFGLTLLFELFPSLFFALKLIGGSYLIYIAWQMWIHAHDPVAHADMTGGPGFLQGVMLNLSNPKPALFYAAVLLRIFPDLSGIVGPAFIWLVALSVEVTFYLGVTALIARPQIRRHYLAAKPLIDRLSGTLIGALGLSLIVIP